MASFLSDDHDVSAFLMHSLTPPADAPKGGAQVSEDEKKKFEQEFDEYWQKLQKAKEEYQKEHPDKKPIDYEQEEERWFESQDMRELKQIFDGQNAIHNTVTGLHKKLDEVIGRQERTLSQISYMSQAGGNTGGGGGTQQGGGAAQLPYIDTIKRHEVDTLLNSQREAAQSLRDLRALVNEVQTKTKNLQSGGGGAGYDTEMKDNINNLQMDIKSLLKQPQGSALECPPPASCVTPFSFFFFAILQIVIIVGYMMYRNSKEAQAKKFY